MATPIPEPADDAPFVVGGTLEKLPWQSYILRGALDTAQQRKLVDRIASLAGYASPRWTERAAAQDHPLIVASHATGVVERPRECRRACGLARCMGHCGRNVGALYAKPDDVFDMARACAHRIERDAGEVSHDPIRFDATHFWSLVYGDRDAHTTEDRINEEENDSRVEDSTEDRGEPSSSMGVGVAGGTAVGKNCGRMQSHLDRPVGWTLSVSVGRPVRFNLGREPEDGSMYRSSTNFANAAPGQGGAGIDVVLRSGDVALFRGHAVFHAVDGFVEETDEDAFSTFSALDATRDGAWRERLLAPARSAPRAGWKPERLALLFRHEVDAAGSERPPARARKKTRTNERYTPGSG